VIEDYALSRVMSMRRHHGQVRSQRAFPGMQTGTEGGTESSSLAAGRPEWALFQ
jgi:hypothetical protein